MQKTLHSFLVPLFILLMLFIIPISLSPEGGKEEFNEINVSVETNQYANTYNLGSNYCSSVSFPLVFTQYIFVGVLITIFAVLALFLLGHYVDSPALIGKAKAHISGIVDVFAFLLIGIFLISISSVLYQIPKTLLPTDPLYSSQYANSLIDASILFSNMVFKDVVKEYGVLLVFNNYVNILYSQKISLGLDWMSMWSFGLGSALRPVIDAINLSLNGLSLAMIEWASKTAFLCFVNKWTYFFIFLGGAFMVYPPTRNFGVILVSIMIALYLVYPGMLIMSYESYKIVMSSPHVERVFSSDLYKFYALATLTGLFIGSITAPFWYTFLTIVAYKSVATTVMYVFLFSIFLPLINITITLTFANEFSKYFGVVTNFMSFMRLI